MLTAIVIWIVAFCNLGLGMIVFLKGRYNFTHISFGIFTCLLAVWLLLSFYSNDTTLGFQLALWLKRFTVALPSMGLYFLILFSLAFTGFARKHYPIIGWVLGLSALAVALLGFSNLIMVTIVPSGTHNAVVWGVLSPFFGVFIMIYFLATIVILLFSLPKLSPQAKARTRIMALSLFLALAVTVATNLVMPLVFSNYSLIVLGLISPSLIVVGFTYAIIRHRLFDIRAVIARSMAYVLLLFTLGSSYALITFKVGGLIFDRSNITTPQQTFNIATAIILAFTFQPLERFFAKITDRVFYHGRYDPQTLINQVGHVLSEEVELISLSRRVRNLLAKNIRVEHVNIVVLNNNKVFAETGHYVVSRLEDLAQDLGKLRGKVIVADEEVEGRRKETLNQYGVSVLASLRTKEDKKIGYLLFGEKLNGDIYTEVDIKVINIIADQLAVAIQNAKAYVQIQRFNHTLQSKIADATKQLREANASLQQIDQVKDEFISMASHQLRTPLTVIDGYLANVLDGMYGTFNEKQRKALAVTQNRVRLTRGLVADLLNMSRIEAGRFFIDVSPVDLNKIIPEEIEQLKFKAAEQETKLIFVPPADKPAPILNIDEQKTRQAIINMVDNAITYSPKGEVTVSLEVVGNQVVFRVIDDGIGVPEADRSKLFSKFFRATNAKRERVDGTGIGLYLVKRVIEEQGGTVLFSSNEGKGSTFGFRLPVASIVPADSKPTKPHTALTHV